jgi:hypothetical protein
MTDPTSVPSPLGWCSWCLGDEHEQHQAVTLFDGTALCQSCNERANSNVNEAEQERADLLTQMETRNNEMFRQMGRPGY